MRSVRRITAILAVFSIILQPYPSYAYVGGLSRIFVSVEKENELSVFTEAIADIVYDRDAKQQAEDTEVEFYGGAAGLTYKRFLSIYGGVGTGKVKEAYDTSSGRAAWESDYGFTWLVGGYAKLYERELKSIPNSTLLCGLSIQYRNTDLDTNTITIDSTKYDASDPSINHTTMEYNDWHVALSCTLDLGRFSPYAGLKYSDFESTVRATRNGVIYQKDNCEADNNLGTFIGIGIALTEQVNGQFEASFIDENSISGSLSIRF